MPCSIAIFVSPSPAVTSQLLNNYFAHMMEAAGREGGIVNSGKAGSHVSLDVTGASSNNGGEGETASMPQREIEIILARQFASYLATPIFVIDPDGNLLYYNESAEAILGCRFDETGEMPMEQWSTIFKPVDENGQPLAAEVLPLAIALQDRESVHRSFTIMGLDGVHRHIHVTAFPLVGQAERFLGAMAIFWEAKA